MKQKARIIILLIIFVILLPVAYFNFPLHQISRMRKADKHAEILKGLVLNNQKFEKVKFGSLTVDDGSLGVVGVVSSEKDLEELKRIVYESNPPVSVKWAVQIEME